MVRKRKPVVTEPVRILTIDRAGNIVWAVVDYDGGEESRDWALRLSTLAPQEMARA